MAMFPLRAYWARIVSDKIKKERNGEVKIYAIAVGEEKHSSGVDVMKEIAKDIEGQNHFFWLDSHDLKYIIKQMISPGNCVFIFKRKHCYLAGFEVRSQGFYVFFETNRSTIIAGRPVFVSGSR